MTTPDDEFDPSMLDELHALSSPEDDLYARVVGIFRRDIDQRVASLRTALAADDGTALHRASHTLKGAAGNLGLRGLMAACSVVVEATRDYELHPRCDHVDPAAIDAIAAAAERAKAWLDGLEPR